MLKMFCLFVFGIKFLHNTGKSDDTFALATHHFSMVLYLVRQEESPSMIDSQSTTAHLFYFFLANSTRLRFSFKRLSAIKQIFFAFTRLGVHSSGVS